jgi:ATP-dependent DNA helicase RecG
MDLSEGTLRQLIAGGESGTVEFKIKGPRPGELAERMCGMANSRTGGIIIFGVADEAGDVMGLKKPNDTIDVVLRAARTVKPPVVLAADGPQLIRLDGHNLVLAQIPANNGTLYQASGVFWIRKGTNTIPMSSDEVGAHLHASGALSWETALCQNATLDDLDDVRLEQYLGLRSEQSRQMRRQTTREELLVRLGCAGRDPQTGVVRPTNVGVLLFGYDPQLLIPHSEVVCVRYDDDVGMTQSQDRQILAGTALELIDSAADFVTRAVRVTAEIIGFSRVDMPDYSVVALREAVVNAVAHRDYSIAGEAIRIFVYTDRIEVHSPGLLPPGVSLAELTALRARSHPRNPVLVQFLRDVPGYMERIGAGIRLMVNEMVLRGLPTPTFVEQHEFVVIFRNGYRRLASTAAEPLNARQLLGLRLIQTRGSITSREYVEATNVSERTALRELRELVERGIIVVRGRTRSARYFLP